MKELPLDQETLDKLVNPMYDLEQNEIWFKDVDDMSKEVRFIIPTWLRRIIIESQTKGRLQIQHQFRRLMNIH